MTYSLSQAAVQLAALIDRDAFLASPTVEARLRLVQARLGRRLFSAEAADLWLAWLRLHLAGLAPDEAECVVREVLHMAPLHPLADTLYTSLMRPWTPPPEGTGVAFMVTSCQKYRERAEVLMAQLQAQGAFACLILGRPELKVPLWDGQTCSVPVADNYESLPDKVVQGVSAILQRHGTLAVVKLDDDCRTEEGFSVERFERIAAQFDYVGEACGEPMSDRCWHIGKTEHAAGIYGRRYHGVWARGAAYLLGARAAQALAREATLYPDEFRGECYEDKAVGDFLRRAGYALTPIPSQASWALGFDPAERYHVAAPPVAVALPRTLAGADLAAA